MVVWQPGCGEKMRNILINIIVFIIYILFMAGFLVFIPVMALIELGFYIVADTKLCWFFKKCWDSRKALRFR